MSYNQPGPYGAQPPQQPGPYGGPQPGPYGQPAPQPGYGYPQQPPPPGVPPQGYPQQPPAYGYQQQPGMPPQPPYGMPQPPKKSKAGIVIGVVVAVAVIAGAGWYFTQGGGASASGPVAADTKGYKLVAPETVNEFKKNPKSQPGTFTDKERKEAEAVGVKNPTQVEQKYQAGDPSNPLTAKALNFDGVYGEIADPEKAVDAYFALAKTNASDGSKTTVELVGSPQAMTPAGFKGAVMKCQEAKYTLKDSTAKGPKEFTIPICIWGDHSTLTMVGASDAAAILAGQKGYTQEQVADLAAKLYNTARVKM